MLIGLCTRCACVAAALFLLMTYLNAPAFPWLPTAPMNEGNYAFVNKNIVEFLALLMIATTKSGYWFGVDRCCATSGDRSGARRSNASGIC